MRLPFRTVTLGAALLSLTSACSLHTAYDPALPAARTIWDNSPLVPVTPPPEELMPPPVQTPPPSVVPSSSEWDRWRPQVEAPPGRTRGKRQPPMPAPVAEANSNAVVKPTRAQTAGGTRAMIQYAYQPGKIYEVHTAPHSPTYLVLPPGERLAAPPAVNPEAWVVGLVQMGPDERRQETVVIRPLQPAHEAATALLFQSGLIIFCKLLAFEKGAMLSVTWDLPQMAPASVPETPIAQRPPKIDVGRLHTGYAIKPQGKLTPPWVPVSVFDDGTRTYVKFREALTYTRAPGVFGLTPQGTTALVQSHMYVIPGQPERGAWLLVQGLWPALELKDSAGLTVRLVRQAAGPGLAQEVTYTH